MADVVETRVKGNLLFIDQDGHLRRVVDAIGPDVTKYIAHPSDFGSAGQDPSGWTTTMVETGGGGDSDINGSATPGATFDIVTDNAENDGVSAQMGGSVFELTSDQDLYFGIRFKINDVTQSDFFLGLAVTDTAILGGVTDRIGFQSLDGSTDLKFMVEKDSSETLTAALATLADDTYVTCEFYWNGTALTVFVNDAEVTGPALTNLPDDLGLRLSLELLTGEAAAQTMTVQWLRVIQVGR